MFHWCPTHTYNQVVVLGFCSGRCAKRRLLEMGHVSGWKSESISFACVQCGSLTNPFISLSMCVCVCVCLSGITHCFQTCLSSTLVCVRESVRACTSECEIPLGVLKPALAYCLLRYNVCTHTETHEHTCTHTQLSLCTCLFFLCRSPSECIAAFGEVLYQVMVLIFLHTFHTTTLSSVWCLVWDFNYRVCVPPAYVQMLLKKYFSWKQNPLWSDKMTDYGLWLEWAEAV